MIDLGRPWPKSNRKRARYISPSRPRHLLFVTSQARHTSSRLSDDSTAAKAVLCSLHWLLTYSSGKRPSVTPFTQNSAAYCGLLALAFGFPWLAANVSRTSFQRALKEMMEKGFIAESTKPYLFWFNPNLFFNGNRMTFVHEFRKNNILE